MTKKQTRRNASRAGVETLIVAASLGLTLSGASYFASTAPAQDTSAIEVAQVITTQADVLPASTTLVDISASSSTTVASMQASIASTSQVVTVAMSQSSR